MRILIIVLSIIFVVCMIGTMMLYIFADHIKPIRKFYCRMGWHCHSKDYIFDSFDGASEHCTCKWCGYKGMVDSQGNLF
jgi:hypothetical protein